MTSEQDIARAEEELDRLSAQLETVVKADAYLTAVLALGHRARSLFLGFRHLLSGPAPVAAMSLLRPMVEINLLLRFLGRDPDLHVELWMAEGQRQIVAILDEYENDVHLLGRWGPLSEENRLLRESYREQVQIARDKALAAKVEGVREKGPVLPSTATMAKTSDDPGAREAYTLAYRRIGSDVHAGALTFASRGFVERVGGLVSYSDIREEEDVHAARTLATSTFASTLCIVSAVLGLDIHERADEIKQAFIPEEPPIAERLAAAEPGPTP